MKVAFSRPNIGPIATTESVTAIERCLYTVKLQAPYPATPDGSLPEEDRYVLDPLDALTFVAAQTKIRLGIIQR